jgi:hypothetical protein
MFTGIPVALLATALPFNLCWVHSQVLGSLTCRVQFARVAHEFQISMNSLFQQGENVARNQGLGTRDWRLEIGDWRLPAICGRLRVATDHLLVTSDR